MAAIHERYTETVDFASPLMYAVAGSSKEGVRLLIGEGAEVDAANEAGITALMMAAAMNNRAAVNMLLAAGASVDAQANDVSRMKYQCSRAGKVAEIVSTFFPSSSEGGTALWLAAAAGHLRVVRTLLAAGADPDAEASCVGLLKKSLEEKSCTPRRAAELRSHLRVANLLRDFEPPAPAGDQPATALPAVRTGR